MDKPFPHEDELKTKSARLDELNILLNMDKRENEIVDGDVGDEVTAPARGNPDRERCKGEKCLTLKNMIREQAADLPPYIVCCIISADGCPTPTCIRYQNS